MKVSLNWLRRYVDITVPLQELCDKMIMSGFEVDGIDDLSQTMDNVVTGRIIRLEKHPDADRLQICQLDVGGEEPVQIVTGADNVFEGAMVPVALHDSHLPNGAHIKKGKLRGVPPTGCCSGEELCLREADYPGAEVHGILILTRHESCPVGTDMREILGMNDVIIDFSVTANRPRLPERPGHCAGSRRGAESSHPPARAGLYPENGDIHDHIRVTVEDFDLCPRYYGRVVTNLRVGPSPSGCSNA